MTLTDDEQQELEALQNEMHLCSLGDRPQSIAASKLRRLIELESKPRTADDISNLRYRKGLWETRGGLFD